METQKKTVIKGRDQKQGTIKRENEQKPVFKTIVVKTDGRPPKKLKP